MLKCKLIRKPVHDFIPDAVQEASEYQGANPSFTPVGVYRDVVLVYPDQAEIEESDGRAFLSENGRGVITFQGGGAATRQGLVVKLRVTEPGRWGIPLRRPLRLRAGRDVPLLPGARVGRSRSVVAQRHGPPIPLRRRGLPLQGRRGDRLRQKAGRLPEGRKPSSFEFLINGKTGAALGRQHGSFAGVYPLLGARSRRRLFKLVENANMNTLRIWGEGIPLPECFYEEADARGILIWQEFFAGHCNLPRFPAYTAKYLKEARELILRLRHHASLLMWCGGNETIMGAEQVSSSGRSATRSCWRKFPGCSRSWTRGRYYHPSSPSGGAWSNDPRAGDYHTYNCVLEYPYQAYPNFTSECIRTAPPVKHSLSRFVKGDLWPKGYDGKFHHEDTFPFPNNWAVRTCHRVRGEIKTGPYWEFYDADNEDQLIYRFAAAYGKDLRKELERIRMGSRDDGVPRPGDPRASSPASSWIRGPRSTAPSSTFSRRASSLTTPPSAACSLCSSASTARTASASGSATTRAIHFRVVSKLGLYSLTSEKYIAEETIPVSMGQGESGIIRDLAEVRYFFPKETLLTAQLLDASGELITYSVDYVTEERRLQVPRRVPHGGNSGRDAVDHDGSLCPLRGDPGRARRGPLRLALQRQLLRSAAGDHHRRFGSSMARSGVRFPQTSLLQPGRYRSVRAIERRRRLDQEVP